METAWDLQPLSIHSPRARGYENQFKFESLQFDLSIENLPPRTRNLIGRLSPKFQLKRLEYALGSPVQKPTGLENLSDAEFGELVRQRGAFDFAKTNPIYLNSSWEGLLGEELLRRPAFRQFRRFLRLRLQDAQVTELGAGRYAVPHSKMFHGLFGVRQYIAVDQVESIVSNGGVQSDVLEYLSAAPSNSTNLVAFGLLNEPLSPTYRQGNFMFPTKDASRASGSHIEHEYLRRLASEMYRVVPAGGLLYGVGMHACGEEKFMEHYLLKAGFEHELRAYELLQQASGTRTYDPYFLQKPSSQARVAKARTDEPHNNGELHRYAAFTTDPDGGNPAGIWLGDSFPEATEMQEIAKRVGYSETAFIVPRSGLKRTVRYFSPEAEVSFCGHATLAGGVMLGQTSGEGTYRLDTSVGVVPVTVEKRDGSFRISITTVATRHSSVSPKVLTRTLLALGWDKNDLDPSIPPVRAYAGAWHLVLAVSSADRLAELSYDFNKLKAIMVEEGLTTLQLVWKENENVFHSRNPFPVGGVVEDPATGAAAAALGGYLRDAGLIEAPSKFTVFQGEAMGRPSQIDIEVPKHGGIVVSGQAAQMR